MPVACQGSSPCTEIGFLCVTSGVSASLAPLGRSVCLADAPFVPPIAGDVSLAASRRALRASNLEQNDEMFDFLRQASPLAPALTSTHSPALKKPQSQPYPYSGATLLSTP